LDLAQDQFAWEVWGIELSAAAVEIAQRRHGQRVTCTTIEDFEPPSGISFDVITAIAVVEHLRDPRELFKKVASWLNDGGVCILELPNASSLPARLSGRYWPPIAAPEHVSYLGPRHIEKLCGQVGLRYVDCFQHWKNLSIGYVYHQLQFFGPELRTLATGVLKLLPTSILSRRLYFYVGEMYAIIRKL
jgi:SAM-dependent methyltransferase